MRSASFSRLRAIFFGLSFLAFSCASIFAGPITITNPQPGSTVAGTVSISASASESIPFHIEIWDNGSKLGNFFNNTVNTTQVSSKGPHTTTVLAVSNSGVVLDRNNVSYNVAAAPPPAPPAPPAPAPSGAGGVSITSPTSGSTSISAVTIAASVHESVPFHTEIWDNGSKLGDVFSGNVNGMYVLPNGSHVLTVQAVNNNSGAVISNSTVNYNVAENCSNSNTMQCNLDQLGIDDAQNDCNPPEQSLWVANPCGPGVQGVDPAFPQSTLIQSIYEGSAPLNQDNLTLNGRSAHLLEVQGSNPSNVLFRGQSPSVTPATAIDSHWTLDQYVYLPDPNAHQAFEVDAQYTAGGIWTKFYTECAFNIRNGTGYWAVFDSATGGWIFLNGQNQNGQTPPVVPCNRSQFSQPWPGSSHPAFTGWHHIAWSFLRNPNGTVTFERLIFDGTTTEVNFTPNSGTGGNVSDNGKFSALIQLDGVVNSDRQHDVVDAYVSEVNLSHTP